MKVSKSIIVYGTTSEHKNNIFYVNEKDLEVPHGEDYKIALEELKKIKDSKINNSNFLESFKFQDYSLWWFIFHNLTAVYKKYINFIQTFEKLIEDNQPEKIIIKNDFDKFDIIQQLCIKHRIKLHYSKSAYINYLLKKSIFMKLQKPRFAKITSSKIERRKKLFLSKKNVIPQVDNKIIFATPTIYRRFIFDHKTGHSKKGEYLQDAIMDLIPNEEFIGIDIDYTFRGEFDKFSERLSEKIPWIPIEILLKSDTGLEKRRFMQNYKKLLLNKNFQQLFVYNGIDLWSSVKKTFEEMSYKPNLPFYIDLVNSLSKFFATNKPKAIFLPYETGPYALAIILACSKHKIKTIGISHGFIAKFMPMYSHFSCRSFDNMLGHPIPDFTLVFGNFAKNVLVENGYPTRQIIVFGNPSFFNFDKITNALLQNKPRKKYNINENDKVILFTTGKLQPKYTAHGNYDYDVQIWKHLVNEFGNKPNYFLLLKPHPQESDVTIYKDIVEKTKTKNFKILNGDLFELIFVSDIVVSVYSTTMIDALCFQKPVIQVKFKDEVHPIPFEEYKTIITCKVNELSSKINTYFSGAMQNELGVNRSKFLKEQYGIPEDNPTKILSYILNN